MLWRTGSNFSKTYVYLIDRSATIKCLEDCHFAVLNKASYEKIFKREHERLINKKVNILKPLPILDQWNLWRIVKLSYLCSYKNYKIGNHVYNRGEVADTVYLVTKGIFEVTFKSHYIIFQMN